LFPVALSDWGVYWVDCGGSNRAVNSVETVVENEE
jgi:hypothetical protein